MTIKTRIKRANNESEKNKAEDDEDGNNAYRACADLKKIFVRYEIILVRWIEKKIF